jgi:iron complex transport system permease protein
MQYAVSQLQRLRHWRGTAYLLALTLCVSCMLVATVVGSVAIPIDTVIRVLWHWVRQIPDTVIPSNLVTIIVTIRLPRVVMVMCAGAALGGAGAAYQGLFRNPLADPYVIGVASGAGLGAISAVALSGALAFAWYLMPLGAFVGALLVVGLVYLLARGNAQYTNNDLILAGVALAALANALTTYIMLNIGRQLSQLLGFLLGSATIVGWDAVGLMVVSVIIGMTMLLIAARDLNVLLFPEEQARFLGINVARIRALVVIGATLMTATAVAFHGLIGFVGIIVPHSVRLFVGGDHRRLIPLSACYGAIFLLLADMLARTIQSPQEIPVGIVTACCGAPFFLWQLRATKKAA